MRKISSLKPVIDANNVVERNDSNIALKEKLGRRERIQGTQRRDITSVEFSSSSRTSRSMNVLSIYK